MCVSAWEIHNAAPYLNMKALSLTIVKQIARDSYKSEGCDWFDMTKWLRVEYYLYSMYMCNELGVMGSGVNLTQNTNRHYPMNI